MCRAQPKVPEQFRWETTSAQAARSPRRYNMDWVMVGARPRECFLKRADPDKGPECGGWNERDLNAVETDPVDRLRLLLALQYQHPERFQDKDLTNCLDGGCE